MWTARTSYSKEPQQKYRLGTVCIKSCSVRVKDLYSSMNHNIKIMIHHWEEIRVLNSKQTETLEQQKSTQQQTNSETLEQQNSDSWTPVGPTKDRSSGPNQLNWKLYSIAIIKSEVRPTLCLENRVRDTDNSFLVVVGFSIIMFDFQRALGLWK